MVRKGVYLCDGGGLCVHGGLALEVVALFEEGSHLGGLLGDAVVEGALEVEARGHGLGGGEERVGCMWWEGGREGNSEREGY